MHFPWPKPNELPGPVVRLAVRDAVWVAAIRRALPRHRASSRWRMPVVEFDDWQSLGSRGAPNGAIDVVEVTQAELAAVADWIAASRAMPRRVVTTLLSRNSSTSPDDRQAAERLLHEAGSKLTLSSSRQVADLAQLAGRFCHLHSHARRDPLDVLPLRCWGPAWQAGPGTDRVERR